MNNNAKKWIEALESGEYQQGKFCLRENDKFCCLGVLCDIYNKGTGRGKWEDGAIFIDSEGDNFKNTVPKEVADWVKMKSIAGKYAQNTMMPGCLVTDNDTGVSFDKIAKIIQTEDVLFDD